MVDSQDLNGSHFDPDATVDRLFAAGVDGLVEVHIEMLGAALLDLRDLGFTPSHQLNLGALQAASDRTHFLSAALRTLFEECKGWVSVHAPISLEAESATNLIGALCVFWRVRADCVLWTPNEVARQALASHIVGLYEASRAYGAVVRTAAELYVRREKAASDGARGAESAKNIAEEWRVRARAAWRKYDGNLSKSAWAEKHCGRFGKSKSSVIGALRGIEKSVQNPSSLDN